MNAIIGLRRSAFFTLLILAYILNDFVYSQRNEVSSTLVGIVRTNRNTVIFQPCLALPTSCIYLFVGVAISIETEKPQNS